jgi:hypothetical protein
VLTERILLQPATVNDRHTLVAVLTAILLSILAVTLKKVSLFHADDYSALKILDEL